MSKKKRILILILSMILLLSHTMLVSAVEDENYGTLYCTYQEYLNTSSPMTREFYYEDLGQTYYPIFSDGSEYIEGEYQRVIGYFIVSNTPLDEINDTFVSIDSSGKKYVSTVKRVCKSECPDYKSMANYEKIYKPYLAQFGITDENYDDFIQFSSDKYYGIIDFSTSQSKDNSLRTNHLDGNFIELYPLKKDGTKLYDDKISSLATTIVNNLNYVSFIPFLYGENLSDDGGDGSADSDGPGNPLDPSNKDEFVCYLNVTQVLYKLSLRNKCRFYWDVQKYPQFKDGHIELRAYPYNQKAKINGINDPYWFSSIDTSNKKDNQEYFSLGSFNDGEYIAIDYYLDDYYQNILEKISEVVAPYNSGDYRFQLRVCDSNNVIRTNWITFDLNDMQREYTSSIIDNSGNVLDDNIYDNEDFDSDFRNEGQTSDIFDKNDPDNNKLNDITDIKINEMKFQTWLNSAYSNVKSFSSLLSTFYGWLPGELIYSIGVSIIIVITLRILGR